MKLLLSILCCFLSLTSFAVIGPITGSPSVCVGTTTTLADTTAGGAWSSSNTAIADIDATTGVLTGIATGAATITYTTSTGFVIAPVTVNPLPHSYNIIGGGSYCAGGSGAHIGLDGSEPGVTYQLLSGITPVGATVLGYGLGLDLGTQTIAGTYSVNGTNNTTGCVVNMTGTASVSIDPIPTAFTVTGGGNYCSGGTGTMIGLSGSEIGRNYNLQSAPTPLGPFTTVPGSVAGTGSAISFGLQTNAATFRAVATDALTGCSSLMTGSSTITVNTAPAITGPSALCPASTAALIAGTGSWASSTPAIATVGTSTGIVTAIALGTCTITYTDDSTGCHSTRTITVSTGPSAITGSAFTCVGSTITLSNAVPGGVWSSSAISIAAIGSLTNILSGVSAGTVTITYSLGTSCTVTKAITINALPIAFTVTGGGNICAGGTGLAIGLNGSENGKNYSLQGSPTGLPGSFFAIPGTIAGTGSAISFGLQTGALTFRIVGTDATTACTTVMNGTSTIVVNTAPAISGPTAFCPAATGLLTTTGGGNWSCSSPGVATIGTSTGIVTGVSTGTSTITYTMIGTGCYSTQTVTVSTGPASITGLGFLCTGATVSLSNAVPGGVWSSSSNSIATAGSLSGVVSGISAGSTTITYSLGSGCTVTKVVTVNALPIAFTVTGGGNYCSGGSGVGIGLSGSQSGVSYQLYRGSIAVGAPIAGTGSAISFGVLTATGTYTISGTSTTVGCSRLMTGSSTIVINPQPIITGPSSVCVGSTITLAPSSGGTWSTTGSFATVSSGLVTGTAAGIANISLTLPTGCYATYPVTVLSSICAGTPIGGAAAASVPVICSGDPEVISLTAASTGCGIRYQWQNSPDGTTFTDIAGASLTTYTYTPTTAEFIRCKVICITSGFFDYSSISSVMVRSTIASHSIASSIDTVCNNLDFYITACGISSSFNVTTWFGDGTSTNTPLSSTGICNAHIYHSYNLPGTYFIKQVLYIGTVAQDSVSFSHEYLYCKTLPIKFYFDANSNCVYDGGDRNILLPIKTEIDSNGIPVDTVSATSGFYYKALGGIGTVYGFRIISTPPGLHTTCPVSGIIYDTIQATVNNYHTKYLGLECTTGTSFDLTQHVTMITGPHRQDGTILVNNTFCTPQNADVTVRFDPRYHYHSATPPATAHTDSTATWHIAGLTSGSTSYPVIGYRLEVPGGYSTWLTNGDTVKSNIVTVAGSIGDLDASNNVIIRNDTVKSSYDPNDISVSPAGHVLPCTQLQYTIRFENDGNDTAHNIYVMDTLSDDLDPHSINIEIATSVMNLAVINNGGHRILKFDFPNIMLPDSSHHNQCSGMVIFNIKTKPGIADGTIIPNRAGIFFDDNPVVLTNTIQNTIGVPPVTGSNAVCTGLSIPLANSKPGGTWSSSTPAIASIGTTGIVTSVSYGTTVISYGFTNACTTRYATKSITVNPSPAAISGIPTLCTGATTTLTDTGSGTWTSSNTGVATVLTSGIVTGVSADTAVITYALSTGCKTTRTITVNPMPAPIVGPASACAGETNSMTDPVLAGVWQSSNTAVIAIGSASGISTALTAGYSTISYMLSGGCTTTKPITVNPSPTPISGIPTLCTGATTSLTDTGSGTWTSSNTAVATVLSSGIVTGISADTAVITYSFSTGCKAIKTITVNPLPAPISGTAAICRGSNITLTTSGGSGSWHSSSTAVASIGSATGIATGISSGTATISYTLPTGCMATTVITINPLPAVFTTTGGGHYCAGDTGVHIGSTGSVVGTNYYLHLGTALTGTFAGSGSALDFGLQTIPGTYSVSATNTATTCQVSMPDSTIIAIDPVVVPAVALTASPGTNVCSGTPVLFTPAAVNGGTAPLYTWNVNSTDVATSGTYTFIPANGDLVKVTLASSATCAHPATTSAATSMTVLDSGAIPVTITASAGLFIVVGQTDTFMAATTSGGTYTYQWYLNSTPVPGATNAIYISNTLFTGDQVRCILSGTGPCPQSGTSAVTIMLNNVGVKTVTTISSILLSPNPNNGSFNITVALDGTVNEPVAIEISNMLGQQVYAGNITVVNGHINESISLNTILQGFYILSLRSETVSTMLRFVIEK